MTLLITVAPAGESWAIHADHLPEDLVFSSGGRAEATARALAQNGASAGESAEVRVYLRGGALAGVLTYAPSRTETFQPREA